MCVCVCVCVSVCVCVCSLWSFLHYINYYCLFCTKKNSVRLKIYIFFLLNAVELQFLLEKEAGKQAQECPSLMVPCDHVQTDCAGHHSDPGRAWLGPFSTAAPVLCGHPSCLLSVLGRDRHRRHCCSSHLGLPMAVGLHAGVGSVLACMYVRALTGVTRVLVSFWATINIVTGMHVRVWFA